MNKILLDKKEKDEREQETKIIKDLQRKERE